VSQQTIDGDIGADAPSPPRTLLGRLFFASLTLLTFAGFAVLAWQTGMRPGWLFLDALLVLWPYATTLIGIEAARSVKQRWLSAGVGLLLWPIAVLPSLVCLASAMLGGEVVLWVLWLYGIAGALLTSMVGGALALASNEEAG